MCFSFILFRSNEEKRAVTILIRGGTKQVVDEVYRTLHDAVHAVANTINKPLLLPGGGAIEVYLARHLRKYALSIKSKKQLAVNAFADALESIPRILASNICLDALDALLELHVEQSRSDNGWLFGLDASSKQVCNTFASGIVEPLSLKRNIILSAFDAVQTILRGDDYVPRRTPKFIDEGGAMDDESDN